MTEAMTAAEQLLEQARKLPREEQMKLAHDLWIEADGPYEDPAEVEAAWATEVGERLEAIIDGSDPGCLTTKSASSSVCDPHQTLGLWNYPRPRDDP